MAALVEIRGDRVMPARVDWTAWQRELREAVRTALAERQRAVVLPVAPLVRHPDPETRGLLENFKQKVWPNYLPDDRLELRWQERNRVTGMSWFDAAKQSYVVTITTGRSLPEMLRTCLHECGHAAARHASRSGSWYGRPQDHWPLDRIYREVTLKEAPREVAVPTLALRKPIVDREAEADAFADRETSRWLYLLPPCYR